MADLWLETHEFSSLALALSHRIFPLLVFSIDSVRDIPLPLLPTALPITPE